MGRRKGTRTFARAMYNVQRRILALVLTAAMILTNVGVDMNTAFAAGSSESVTFSMSGSQLVNAIEEAIANGSEVTADDFDFTNGKIAEFEELLFGEGKIYEAFPEPDGSSMDAELRVFVRLPIDADDMYMVTGDEEIIFLYVNNGEDSISCTTEITRMDDGEERVKKTKRVTVKSYEAVYGDEEVNLISKPVEIPVPEETQGPAAEETTAPEENTEPLETTVPEESDTTETPEETTAAEETTASDESIAVPEETTVMPEETTAASEDAATVPEDSPAEETPADDQPVAFISRHFAPIVADSESTDTVPEANEDTDAPEPEKEEEPKAIEEPTTEETATDVTQPAPDPEVPSEETTVADGNETTVPATDETTSVPSESESADTTESTVDISSEPEETAEIATSSDAEQTTEAPAEDNHVSKAGTADMVGLGYCSTAKVYMTTINQLKALDDFDGYKVSYAIYPESSARIVDGPRGVEEDGTLTFGVKNQLGSVIDYITVNDEIVEAESVVDNENGSQTVWYSIPDIYEEQDVQVYMSETMAHPAIDLEPIVMDDGVIIYISADAGVLPDRVTATAVRVSEDVEIAVKDNAQIDSENKIISSVMAYDINLWLEGKLLDSEIWGGSKRVRVTFAGDPVEEQNAQADAVEVMYVETLQDSNKDEKEKVAAQETDIKAADVVNVETVNASIDESSVTFEAEHFSIYAIVGSNTYWESYEMHVGQKIKLKAQWSNIINGRWTSSDPNKVAITDTGFSVWPYAVIHAGDVSNEPVTITYHYGINERHKQEFKITVKKHEVNARFYIQRPGMDPGSLVDGDWKYVGLGTIDVSGIKNQYGTDMEAASGHYSLENPSARVSQYPNDANIKKVIAELYGVSAGSADVVISYTPYKVTYPNGWVDADGNQKDKTTPTYHMDMTANVTTKEKATVNYWLWDAGEDGYKPVESDTVLISQDTKPKNDYPDKKSVSSVDYVFSGWYIDEDQTQKAEFPYQVNKSANFYAKYNPITVIRINYKAIGGGSVSPEQNEFNAVTEEADGSVATTPKGYEFKGWFDNQEGNGAAITRDLNFIPEKPDSGWVDGMTFYAVWEGDKDSLTYHANKGTGEMAPSTGKVGDKIVVKENGFTREGYYFAGWNTQADGNGQNYKPDDIYTLTADVDELFAVWKEVGTFKVWAYFPDINPDLSYGNYIDIYEDYGPDNSSLTYKKNGTASSTELDLDGVNEILAYSKSQTESKHKGARISSVYLQYQIDTKGNWSEPIYAKLKDNRAVAFDGLNEEVFHEGKESRLHITYDLPRNVQVEYWKNIGTKYEQVKGETYAIGPKYVYAYDYINILEDGASKQDILKAVPKTLFGYRLGNAVYVKGDSAPTGTEDVMGTRFRVYNTKEVQRICILLEEKEDVTIQYRAAEGGSVDSTSETVAPATGNPVGASAAESNGYTFSYWTNLAGESVSTEKKFVPKKNSEKLVFEEDTYTAHFVKRGDLSYRVEYYYDEVFGEADSKDGVSFETEIPYTSVPRTFNEKNYTFEKAVGPKKVGTDNEANLVKVYYVLDEIGVEKPELPDEIPDKYQIKFTYVNGANGSVSGSTSEVHTIQQITRDPLTNEIIKVEDIIPAHPRAEVTAAANSGYVFDNWSMEGNSDKIYSNAEAITKDSFVTDATFIANFSAANNNGGNGGNGGGSGGGGSSSSGGSGRYTGTVGGPGAVTIAPEDVPLAPLPEIFIDDEEVPLAPLPKTGQNSLKMELTLVLSGIFLVITALSRRRREDV